MILTLATAGVAEITLVWFSSDSGPSLTYFDLGRSPGPLRDGKGTSWEGGFRVPGIFRWPGTIPPALIDGIGAIVDLTAAVTTLTGTPLPKGRAFDSIDLSPTLVRAEPSPREEWIYYDRHGNLWAARSGGHKLVFESWDSMGT